MQKTLALKDDEEIRQNLSDAFRGKASSTLQKRALSLQAYAAKHLELHEGSPWRITEDQLYVTLCAFRSGGAKPSTANHVPQALRFFDGVCKLLYANLDSVVSLGLVQVRGLEELMLGQLADWLKAITGQILFCVCMRVAGGLMARESKRLQILGEGPGAILFAQALGSKSSLTAEAQTRFLPYTAVAKESAMLIGPGSG